MINLTTRSIISTTHSYKEDKFIIISKRTMMAKATQLKPTETIANKKILFLLCTQLRKGPFTEDLLLDFLQASHINLKIFQHTITQIFPVAKFSIEKVQARYPNVKLGAKAETLDWNDVIAVHYAAIIKKSNFFASGKLYTHATPPYDPSKGDVSNNAQAVANTGQKNPDYYYIYELVKDSPLWSRYFDLKSGLFEIMRGHIVFRNNSNDFEFTVKTTMLGQKSAFTLMGPDFVDFVNAITKLLYDKTLNWEQRNNQLQLFYLQNLEKLPKDKTPSLVFFYDTEFAYENISQKQLNDIPATMDSCASSENTRNTFLNMLITKNNQKLIENYNDSFGSSPNIQKLFKQILIDFYLA